MEPYERNNDKLFYNNNNNSLGEEEKRPAKKQKTENIAPSSPALFPNDQPSILSHAIKCLDDMKKMLEISSQDKPAEVTYELLKTQNEKLKFASAKVLSLVMETQFIVKQAHDQLSLDHTSLSKAKRMGEKLLKIKNDRASKIVILEKVFSQPDVFEHLLEILSSYASHEVDDILLLILSCAYEQKKFTLFLQTVNKLATSKKSALLSTTSFQFILAKVFNVPEWSDKIVTIHCRNGSVQIHLIFSLISSLCPYFSGFDQFIENETPHMEFDWTSFNIGTETATDILNFFYSGQINFLTVGDAARSLILAESFMYQLLINVCQEWISKYRRWNEKNAFEIYELAILYKNEFLQQVSLSYLAFYAVTHAASSKMKVFIDEHKNEVTKIEFDAKNLPFDFVKKCLGRMKNSFTSLKKLTITNFLFNEEDVNLIEYKDLEFLALSSFHLSQGGNSLADFFKQTKNIKTLKLFLATTGFQAKNNTKAHIIELLKSLSHLTELETLILDGFQSMELDISEFVITKKLKNVEVYFLFSKTFTIQDITSMSRENEKLSQALTSEGVNLECITLPRLSCGDKAHHLLNKNVKSLFVHCNPGFLNELSSYSKLECLTLDNTQSLFSLSEAVLSFNPALLTHIKKLRLISFDSSHSLQLEVASRLAQFTHLQEFVYNIINLYSPLNTTQWWIKWIDELGKNGKAR